MFPVISNLFVVFSLPLQIPEIILNESSRRNKNSIFIGNQSLYDFSCIQ
jgi:hypothetical protein